MGPLLLAAPAYPFMLLMFGLEIGTPIAAFLPFPLFMLAPEINLLGLYLVYFLAGWLMHRHAGLLGGPARWWPLWLAAGTVAGAAAFVMTDHLALQPSAPGYWRARFLALAVYSVATAALSLGFLGLFQRCCRGENRTGRYISDAAYWMYLAQPAGGVPGAGVGGLVARALVAEDDARDRAGDSLLPRDLPAFRARPVAGPAAERRPGTPPPAPSAV